MRKKGPKKSKIFTEPSERQMNALINLYNQQQYAKVEEKSRQLIVRFPKHPFAWKVLGAALEWLGKLEEALEAKKISVSLAPNDANAIYNLGNSLRDFGRLTESEACYKKAIEIKPDYALSYYNLGLTLTELGRKSEAEKAYRSAIQFAPKYFKAYNNLGRILREKYFLKDAEDCYRTAINLNPDYIESYCNLGENLIQQGRSQESEANYRQALALNSQHLRIYSSWFVSLNYNNHSLNEYYHSEEKKFGQLAREQATIKFSQWHCEPHPERLRIGFVSGDFRTHVVSYFLENMLIELKKNNKLDLFAYSNFLKTDKIDKIAERFKGYFNVWHPIASLTDEAAAQLIHDDNLHILFDLSGHTAHNRLPLFAYKAAPIQVTWLGYWATTGIEEIDYILVDEVGVPNTKQACFCEKLVYLPDTRLCFSAPKDCFMYVKPLPALKNGFITFGCFQSLKKVTDEMLSLWGKILTHLPAAKIRFQCPQFHDKKFVTTFYKRLEQVNITPNQVELYHIGSRFDYFIAHSSVDMILDTFPFTGGTTTCEALWMGVPTLTLAGNSLISRQGASLLSAAGLENWIATHHEDYINKAVYFANDIEGLANLRSKLREQVLASPLFDAPRFAKNFEKTLWQMWEKYDHKNSLAFDKQD